VLKGILDLIRRGGTEVSMITQLDLEAIKARADAATPGPWFTEYGYKLAKVMTKTAKGHGRVMLAQDWIPRQGVDGPLQDDAEFIAHARTDIPLLLAEVERLTALIQKQEEAK
jgi:hypothetical protein